MRVQGIAENGLPLPVEIEAGCVRHTHDPLAQHVDLGGPQGNVQALAALAEAEPALPVPAEVDARARVALVHRRVPEQHVAVEDRADGTEER